MSAPPLAHGLGTGLVEPDWEPLTAETVGALGGSYPELRGAPRVVWNSPRPFSSAAVVEGDRGPVFVKRYHRAIRDAEGLGEEHRFQAHLGSRGVPVSRLVVGDDGQTVHSLGAWTYEVQQLAAGVDVYRDARSWTPFFHREHARSAGRTLAQVHLASEDFSAPARPIRPLVSSWSIFRTADPAPALEAFVAARPALAGFLSARPWRSEINAVLGPFHRQFVPWLGALDSLWTHNDWHASNLLWTGSEPGATVATVIDFGLADRTSAVFDLATALERNTVGWLAWAEGRDPEVQFDHAAALVEGYSAVRGLSDGEARALPALLPLVHAEFALAEIDYFAGIVGSPSSAELAYEGYLLGHARWFQTAAGRDLLGSLSSQGTIRKQLNSVD